MTISKQRSRDIIDALRRGTVPQYGLDALAVGLDPLEKALSEELNKVAGGGSVFKAVRGEYGSGKTFASRWLREKAHRLGFACAEVQVSETETPLHRLETVYRRLMERLTTPDSSTGAFRNIVESWFYTLEEDVLSQEKVDENDVESLVSATDALMEKRLGEVVRTAPAFALTLRAYRKALVEGREEIADGLLAWMAGQPNIAASIKRYAEIKGDIDHFGALSFLQGVLTILKDSGHSGLLLVLDEVETLQRMRGDVRDKSLNALRQLMDEIDSGRFPGLYLLITGTPAFFDGPMGVQRLAPLAQRLAVDFSTDSRFDNPRAVQIRLKGFDLSSLEEVGQKVRDLYANISDTPERVNTKADDTYIADLAKAVTGNLGGKIGVAPRIFLKKLVGDVLDRIDQHDEFNPREHYALTISDTELNAVERAAKSASSVDDIELDL
ncbi:Methyl-accepting chemotaxis protein [Hahella chejuensis KCTC 2396]|uniref:Methyl-accepting chemotaxis protein n=1 Tax=Hahella chejuensis (strain KCTC 2396) TaxID=349521 RepID=Q2SGL3_HAHCH|nr:BREX system ATP-binding protein BrxD [Hahella chejuensis]ABC30211.1 Methyl-accepting chemotaxis protein [Hahella chejuensis KCTC 2396]